MRQNVSFDTANFCDVIVSLPLTSGDGPVGVDGGDSGPELLLSHHRVEVVVLLDVLDYVVVLDLKKRIN